MTFREIPGILFDDPPIPEADKSRIHPLDESRSRAHWDFFISPKNRHFRLLDKTDWPAITVSGSPLFYNWLDDWNNDSPAAFARELKTLDIKSDDTIYVFWMREH